MMNDSINLMNIVIYKEEYLISKDTPPPPPLGKEPTKYIFQHWIYIYFIIVWDVLSVIIVLFLQVYII